MSFADLLAFAVGGLGGHRLRTALSLLGVVIGVSAVVMLTALGEGARRYVIDQFSSLGTNLVIVLPGKTETTGIAGVGGVPNDLTIDDALAVSRRVAAARRVAPIAMATEEVAYRERRRQVAVVGVTAEYQEVRQLELGAGTFIPPGDWKRGSPVAILGVDTARELFQGQDPLGRVVRIGEYRMRVIGILGRQGVKMGLNFDEVALIPVQTAMRIFNRPSLFRVIVQAHTHADLAAAREEILRVLKDRHGGEEDVTVVTQDAVLATFSSILGVLTLALGAIAAVSLSVAGIGIMNVMLVSVSERTREIGLLKALGVSRRQILGAFLAEASILSTAGGVLGLVLGSGAIRVLVAIYPALPASPPLWAVAAALGVSLTVGVTFGIVPARRATRLDPVQALGRR